MTIRFRQTSDNGITPRGDVDPANMLKWLDDRIIAANLVIDNSAHNGSGNPHHEGYRKALKELKTELFGDVFNT
jgi:hypothetical protein